MVITEIDIRTAMNKWREDDHQQMMRELFGGEQGGVGARVPSLPPNLPGAMKLEVPA